jgi:hypothetical protein
MLVVDGVAMRKECAMTNRERMTVSVNRRFVLGL